MGTAGFSRSIVDSPYTGLNTLSSLQASGQLHRPEASPVTDRAIVAGYVLGRYVRRPKVLTVLEAVER